MIGRDLSDAIRAAEPAAPSEPILFTTDDEISEGNEAPASPFQKAARMLHRSGTIIQPNHLETVIAEVDVDGEQHLVKFSRYHDNQQFWTVPGERDERIHKSKTYHRHRARARRVRALRPDRRPVRGAQPRPPDACRRPFPQARGAHVRAPRPAAREKRLVPRRRRNARLHAAEPRRRRRERRDETEGADRLLHAHETVGQGRGRDGEGARGARLRGDEGADRVHRRTVGADALPVSDGAPGGPDRDRPPCTDASQDRGDPHSLRKPRRAITTSC